MKVRINVGANFQEVIMHIHFRRAFAHTLLAGACLASFATGSFAQSADTQIAEAAQKALSAQMGDAAKDLQVRVANGDATLSGWAHAPKDVPRAEYIVSTVPGVQHAYGIHVHTWVSTDPS